MSKHRSSQIFVNCKNLTKTPLVRAEYVLGWFSALEFKINILSTIAVAIVSGGLDCKLLFIW